MNEQLAEKFATVLAAQVAQAKTASANAELRELVKQAATKRALDTADFKSVVTNPLFYGPLLGTSVGGLGGYLATGGDDKKKKKRNAMYGALTGALGGLGIPLYAMSRNQMAAQAGETKDAPKTPAGDSAEPLPTAEEAALAAGVTTSSNPIARTVSRAGMRGGAGLAGYFAGGPLSRGLERIIPAPLLRSGELRRLGAPAKGLFGTKPAKAELDRVKNYGDSIEALRNHVASGGDAKGLLPPFTAPNTKPIPKWVDWVRNRPLPATASPKQLRKRHLQYVSAVKAIQADNNRAIAAAAPARAAYDARISRGDRLLRGMTSRFPFALTLGTLGTRGKTRADNAALLQELLTEAAKQRGGSAPAKPNLLTTLDGMRPTLRQRGLRLGTRAGTAGALGYLMSPERADYLQDLIHKLTFRDPPVSAGEPAVK